MPKTRDDLNSTTILLEMTELYLSGASLASLAKKYKTSRSTIATRLADQGVSVRGHKEANALFSAQLSPEEKKRKATAAHDAVRGKKRTHKELLKRSLTREQNLVNVSPYEVKLMNELSKRGVLTTPQKSFDIFNVDLLVDGYKVVIEIFGGGWHGSSKQHIDNFNIKSELLHDMGYSIVVCWTTGEFDAERLADRIEDILENPKPYHYVFRGNGNPSKIGHKKLKYILYNN